MASTYLTRTQGSGNRKIFTQSFWCKVCDTSGTQSLAGAFDDSNNYSYCFFDGGNLKLQWKSGGSVIATLDTNRKFRDPNAWYHIVYAVDTTQSTSADRIKLYVNGVQETSFSTATYPNQNASAEINGNGITYNIGSASSGQNFNGVMSHLHFCDGTALAPTVFGETDSTTGEWKINTSPSFTPGTNGFTILKDGNTITDQSSNSNNFALGGGTLTNTEDCPSNVFATFNPLDVPEVGEKPTYSYGNLQGASTNAGHINGISSLAVETGKFYAEFKCTVRSGATDDFIGCIASPASLLGSTNINTSASNNKTYGIRGDGSKYEAGTGSGSYSGSYAINDIIGVGLDITNNRLYFSKNGQWQNGTSWDSATPNTYITLPSGNVWHFLCGDTANSQSYTWQANFGNGYFGTTAISSEGTNASGIGKFEYDVPTGYTALSTKGLNE